MKSKKIVALVVAAALVTTGSAVVGTRSWFTSKAESQKNEFKAGTLKLGGIINGKDEIEKFERLELDNLQPGTPYKMKTVQLKNVGSLPMKIYRITGSNFTGDQELLNDDNVMVHVDMIKSEDSKETRINAFTGKLSQLKEENGGYFNPIYNIQPGEVVGMELTVMVNPKADNKYQEKHMECDLNVFASQSRMPNQGEPQGTVVKFNGPKVQSPNDPTFSVTGKDEGEWITFQYNWQPWDYYNKIIRWDWTEKVTEDHNVELYNINMKNATGDPSVGIGEVNFKITRNTHKFGWPFTLHKVVAELQGGFVVSTNDENMSMDDVKVDFDANTISVRKSALPKGWDIVEVQLGGIQRENMPLVYTDYQQMSLNRHN